ncbi:hypothetical protein PVAP13_9NG789300 [Panicum virgatum]|uniref:Zinc finger CCCH domain-containing protein 19 n=2 Tax=Panicum virgatum TaxID=38727 RepID=A0A8T0NAY0_PANVG|nr:hypothetical protein PVAP13_9NG789300 [Panicum virgatum]
MDAGAQQLTPPEADWPPELRLPPPPQAPGMDDSQFLSSIIGVPPRQDPPAPKRRGRPPKNKEGPTTALVAAAPKPAKRKDDDEEVVCFICFDGGNLVVCDRRGCPKVYHPACIKRDEAFFQSRSKWNCGWHICSSCEKAVHYMCYTCTYSLCKVCIKQGKFFSVRGTKGFCDTCFGTILLIESKDESATKVDFDDILSWEYLFKLYWLDLKGKLSLTLEELTNAKNRWNVPITPARKEKDESSDDLYDVNNDDDAGSDCSSRKRRRGNSARKKVRKRRKVDSDCNIAAKKVELPVKDAGGLPTEVLNERTPLPVDTKVPIEQVPLPVDTKEQNEWVPLPVDMEVQNEWVPLPVDTKWASPELLEFVGHMRGGDQSFISQFDVQTLLLEYIKKNNLRDPKRKSQIVCDTRLHRLFRKSRVAHFEMLKLLEMHFLMNETPKVSDNSQVPINPNLAQVDNNGYSDMAVKLSPDKRRRMHRKMDREPQVNLEAYAAIDMHNINLIYIRRSLMEDLIDDATFSDKIYGAFVRIKISGVGQKQDIYRLVKVVGTHKVPEKYSIGKKMTNFALEILNLDKKEIITMDTISNQDFTEEECKRLRQSMKCGLISRLKVGYIQEKAKILQSVRVNDWFENEKERLGHLRDRASETGRRKEFREYVEKLQLLNNSEERTRRINEVLEVHVDSHMDPNYESAEEMDDKKAVARSINRTGPDTSISRRKSKYTNTMQNHPQKVSDSSRHPKNLSWEGTIHGSGAGRKFENTTIANRAVYEAGSLSLSGVTMSGDTEPEKVWHYKDPAGNVQGPFTLLQLSKWISYFPRDLRVWLTFESEERSLLLTEVLSKQQKDFTQASSLTSSKATLAGTRHTMNSPSVDQTNALSPVGYSMAGSSGITVQSNKYYAPERESVYSPDDSLSLSTSSVPPKDVHTVNSQAQCQAKHSVLIPSPGNSYGQTDLHHGGVQGGYSGESNHRHSSGALCPVTAHMSCCGRGNVESHQNQHVLWSQCQHDSKGSSQCGSVKDLNSRRDLSKNLPTQRVGKDVSSPLFAWSPSESRTASSQHEGSCLSSTTNPNFLDELHSSIAFAKPMSCAPATPIEDRGSSSPSGMLSHSERVPICSPDSGPLASASDICKMEEIMNQQRTLEADTSNASVNQSPQSKIFHVSSPDNQDIDCEVPSPTPRSENKELAVAKSGLTPASPENVTTTNSPDSDTHTVKIVSQQKLPEVVASNSSGNHSQSKVSPESSNSKDLECECPSSSPRSENKVPDADNSLLTSAAPENLPETSAPASGTCKMEFVNQKKTLDADASNAPLHQPPHSHISPASPHGNHDIGCECPPRSDSKEPLLDNLVITSMATENVTTASASASDTCKMEECVNQQKIHETDASNGPLHQLPHSNISPASPPDNQEIGHECPPRSDSKEPLLDNLVITSMATENVTTASASSSDTCKMEERVNQQKIHETDASNGPLHQLPHSNISPASPPDNQEIGRECPPRSDSKEPLLDNLVITSMATKNVTTASASSSDTCKMEECVNQQKTLETDASNGPLNQPPHSPTSDSKDPIVNNSVLTSVGPENLPSTSVPASGTCKVEEISNKERTHESDASNASLNQPSCTDALCPDNQDMECEYPKPTPRSESEHPLMDNSGLTSIVPENLTSTSASASDICKMEEILNEKRSLEANPTNGSVTQTPQSKVFLVSSPVVLDIEREFPTASPRPETKEPVVVSSVLTSATPENLTKQHMDLPDAFVSPKSGQPTGGPRPEIKETVVFSSVLTSAAPENLIKQHVDSPDAFVSPKSDPITGELDAMKSDFKCEQNIQKELYCESESIVLTRGNMLIDPSCGAESIDVSDVLESLMEEQRCGTSYMQGTTDLEDFLATSAEEEPQCSSPIALSPWGEPSYYQGDAIDSALWGVQDDPINDMWSLLSPRPMLQSSSGIGTEGKETYDINEVGVAHGNNEIVQRGSVPVDDIVNQVNLGAPTHWVLPEQVPSIPHDMSISSVDESTGVVGWQPSANQSLNEGTTWSTSQNLNISSKENAEPSSKRTWEATKKQESTNSSVSGSGEATGNTRKGLNPPSGIANRGSQRNHHRGRYSQISESWLLSSNHSRSRSDRFGSSGSSRSTSKGQPKG